MRPPNQQMRLLAEYPAAGERGLTDEEAADAAKVPVRSNFWKRCGELRVAGLIEQQVVAGKPVVRKGTSGIDQMVCVITGPGRAMLEVYGL